MNRGGEEKGVEGFSHALLEKQSLLIERSDLQVFENRRQRLQITGANKALDIGLGQSRSPVLQR